MLKKPLSLKQKPKRLDMIDFSSVKQLHIEPTSLCNAQCLQCARNTHGEGVNPNITQDSLSLDFFRTHFTSENLQTVEKILFCGNVGDPLASPHIVEIVQHLKQVKPEIVIGINTNGGLKTPEVYHALGNLLNGVYDYVVFSIDGLEDTNHVYRKNTQWSKIVENATAYIATGASAHWDMLVFDHNKHQVSQCRDLAEHMGFSWFRVKETDRWDIYPVGDIAPAGDIIATDYTSLSVDCERNRDSSLFVDYTGELWPCCHMAEAHVNKIGEHNHSDIKAYKPDQLLENYQTQLNTDPYYVCKRSCGVIRNKRSQWKQEIQIK